MDTVVVTFTQVQSSRLQLWIPLLHATLMKSCVEIETVYLRAGGAMTILIVIMTRLIVNKIGVMPHHVSRISTAVRSNDIQIALHQQIAIYNVHICMSI